MTSAAGFKGYGTDCIEFDEKYRNIFEYLLGRTVVVDNMDNAVKLSKTKASRQKKSAWSAIPATKSQLSLRMKV